MNKQDCTKETLPGNTNHAIGNVIAAAEALEDIYCAEINALKKTDTNAFMALQNNKIEAAQNYYSVMTQILERKNELKNIDPDTKKKLREMHTRFNDTTEQNMQMVKRMRRCTAKLGDTLRNAAVRAAQKESNFSYGSNGKIPTASPRKIISSSLCETV